MKVFFFADSCLSQGQDKCQEIQCQTVTSVLRLSQKQTLKMYNTEHLSFVLAIYNLDLKNKQKKTFIYLGYSKLRVMEMLSLF